MNIGERHNWIFATPASDGALAASSLAMVRRGLGHERILEKSNGKRRHHESHHQPGGGLHAERYGREDTEQHAKSVCVRSEATLR